MHSTTGDCMENKNYNFNAICKIFKANVNKLTFYGKADKGQLPSPVTEKRGKVNARLWSSNDLPEIGKQYGFLKNSKECNFLENMPCATIASYTKKGGVLKSTLAYNFARISALHGYKTCIIGLDSQCDITRILGHYSDIDEMEDLQEIEAALNSKKGLYDFFCNSVSLNEIIFSTDLPTLDYIPETDKIEDLTEILETAPRREYWLEENVTAALRNHYDLIVFDCSPTSGKLVSNAIFSADLIISPLECGINNFRNYKSFEKYIHSQLKKLQKQNISVLHIPTKLNTKQNLSKDIYRWYVENISNCTKMPVKLSSAMEDSIFLGLSIIEHDPSSSTSEDIRQIMIDIFEALTISIKKRVFSEKITLEEKLKTNAAYHSAIMHNNQPSI